MSNGTVNDLGEKRGQNKVVTRNSNCRGNMVLLVYRLTNSTIR